MRERGNARTAAREGDGRPPVVRFAYDADAFDLASIVRATITRETDDRSGDERARGGELGIRSTTSTRGDGRARAG